MQDNATPPAFFPTKTAIAEAYSVSRSTVYSWERSGLLGKPGKLGYSRAAVAKNLAAFEASKTTAPAGKGDKAEKLRLECERLKAVVRREIAAAEMAELDALRMKGEVIALRDHKITLDIIRDMFLNALDQLVTLTGAKLRDARAMQVMQTGVDTIRQRIADSVLSDPPPESKALMEPRPR